MTIALLVILNLLLYGVGAIMYQFLLFHLAESEVDPNLRLLDLTMFWPVIVAGMLVLSLFRLFRTPR